MVTQGSKHFVSPYIGMAVFLNGVISSRKAELDMNHWQYTYLQSARKESVGRLNLHNIIDENLEFSVVDWRNSSKPDWWQRINLQINKDVSKYIYLWSRQHTGNIALQYLDLMRVGQSDRMMKALKLCALACICTWIDHTCEHVKKKWNCKTKLLEWMVSLYHIERPQPLFASMSKNAETSNMYMIQLLEKEKKIRDGLNRDG